MAKKKAKATKRPTRPAPRKKAVKKAAKIIRKTLKTKKKAAKSKTRPAAKATRKVVRKVAKKVTRRPAAKKAVRKASPKSVKKAVKKVVKKVAKRFAPAPKATKQTKKTVKVMPKAVKKAAPKPKAMRKSAPKTPAALPVPARLQRERKRLPEAEMEEFPRDAADSRLLGSARSGHDELRAELKLHTEASPELTAGDVDAKWQDAYAIGDEAPGGDNMTPDQDRVDDIGKAIGVVYDDDEELMGGDEISARDEHRWELDPASKEDDEL